MRRRLAFAVVATSFIIAVAVNVQGSAQAPARSSQTASSGQAQIGPAAQAHQAVLSKYCFTCHNEKLKSGGLALSTLDLTRLSQDLEEAAA